MTKCNVVSWIGLYGTESKGKGGGVGICFVCLKKIDVCFWVVPYSPKTQDPGL